MKFRARRRCYRTHGESGVRGVIYALIMCLSANAVYIPMHPVAADGCRKRFSAKPSQPGTAN
jgi:hypothetical protein